MNPQKTFKDHLLILIIGDWNYFRDNWKKNEVIFYISIAAFVLGWILLGASQSLRSIGLQGIDNFYIEYTADTLTSFAAELIIPSTLILARLFYPNKSYWAVAIIVIELILLTYIFSNLDLIRHTAAPNIFATRAIYDRYYYFNLAVIAAIEVFGTFVIFALVDNVQELSNRSAKQA